jgi:hypothetical protein
MRRSDAAAKTAFLLGKFLVPSMPSDIINAQFVVKQDVSHFDFIFLGKTGVMPILTSGRHSPDRCLSAFLDRNLPHRCSERLWRVPLFLRAALEMQIPTEGGRPFRLESGHRSDLEAATSSAR